MNSQPSTAPALSSSDPHTQAYPDLGQTSFTEFYGPVILPEEPVVTFKSIRSYRIISHVVSAPVPHSQVVFQSTTQPDPSPKANRQPTLIQCSTSEAFEKVRRWIEGLPATFQD